MGKNKDQTQGFESSLKSLESIVLQLESGDLPLERALELFEDGIGFARNCQIQLEDAERKVEMLLRERGEIKTIPFELHNDGVTLNSESVGKGSFQNTEKLVSEPSNEKEIDDSIPF